MNYNTDEFKQTVVTISDREDIVLMVLHFPSYQESPRLHTKHTFIYATKKEKNG
jgi:hypothetical protein